MIRPKTYRIPVTKNWGDIFTPVLFKKCFGVEVEDLAAKPAPGFEPDDTPSWRKDQDLKNREEATVFCCGSLLERVPDYFEGHVLGSGMGSSETRRNLERVQAPLLLRGRLTAERCTFQQPVRFGDPGLLAYMLANPYVHTLYRYGVVPHYEDKEHPQVEAWLESEDALLIDIESGIKSVIESIACCELIVSSSLHGLVIADSLGIPSKFVHLSDRSIFKFHDYYSAYNERLIPAATIEDAFRMCQLRDARCFEAVKKDVQDVFAEYLRTLTAHDFRLQERHHEELRD